MQEQKEAGARDNEKAAMGGGGSPRTQEACWRQTPTKSSVMCIISLWIMVRSPPSRFLLTNIYENVEIIITR